MSNYLKTYSRSAIKVENMNLKNKVLFGGWLSTAAEVFRRNKMRGKNLPNRFEDWILRECGIKKQAICNSKNLYRLMIIALKLFNCRVNMTYFLKSHDILLNYFKKSNRHHGSIVLTALNLELILYRTYYDIYHLNKYFIRLIKINFLKLVLVSLGQYQSTQKPYKSV